MTTSISNKEQSKIVTLTSDSVSSKNAIDVNLLGNLIPHNYDYVSLSYTGDDLTGVIYKKGGSGGTTVATLALTYTANVLQTITKT